MIRSERNVPIGGHVTKSVKSALRAEARRLGISISQYIYIAILEKLERSEIDVRDYDDIDDLHG